MSEISVPEPPTLPPLLARLHGGIVYTVNSNVGLRAYSYRGGHKLLSEMPLTVRGQDVQPLKPTSITVDTQDDLPDTHRIILGFEDGSFALNMFDIRACTFVSLYDHPPSSNGAITALACSWPYVLTVTNSQLLSLYRFSTAKAWATHSYEETTRLQDPVLLSSLCSGTVWPPLAVSLQQRKSFIVASIAYSMPTYSRGWSAGVQELHIDQDGDLTHSRLASALDFGFRPLYKYPGLDSSLPTSHDDDEQVEDQGLPVKKPISLSYSHPYLLLSHADNTLTLYMVNSNDSHLSVSPGKRLWGHTSGIFGAHVAERGKAVSVSTHGEEVRLWQLESTAVRKGQAHSHVYDLSVTVTPGKHTDMGQAKYSEGALHPLITQEPSITRGWVGFDDEHVVVLREHHDKAGQALAIYDFT